MRSEISYLSRRFQDLNIHLNDVLLIPIRKYSFFVYIWLKQASMKWQLDLWVFLACFRLAGFRSIKFSRTYLLPTNMNRFKGSCCAPNFHLTAKTGLSACCWVMSLDPLTKYCDLYSTNMKIRKHIFVSNVLFKASFHKSPSRHWRTQCIREFRDVS